jgi:hypothetical protein
MQLHIKHHAITHKTPCNYTQPPPPKSCRAKLPHHSSLQSVLGVLGYGADPGKEFGKNKVCRGLIYTRALVAMCTPLAAACPRIVSALVLARAHSHPHPMAIWFAP